MFRLPGGAARAKVPTRTGASSTGPFAVPLPPTAFTDATVG